MRLLCMTWLMCGALTAALVAADSGGWHTQIGDAKRQAAETGRPILALFTDSVECPWCAKLRKDVLDSAEFRQWATSSVVLLEVDFPSGKPQDPATKAHNESLKKK